MPSSPQIHLKTWRSSWPLALINPPAGFIAPEKGLTNLSAASPVAVDFDQDGTLDLSLGLCRSQSNSMICFWPPTDRWQNVKKVMYIQAIVTHLVALVL